MGEVIFKPDGPVNHDGWPGKVLGDGIVRGEFKRTTDREGEFAVYDIGFGEEVELAGKGDEDWAADVRED